MESVRLVSITPDAEKLAGYIARVSSPANQDNPSFAPLLTYCIKKGHWSVFEHALMTVEIKTSRGIAPQILRHRSFTFQEFSQRYAKVDEFVTYEGRRQADKNRQSSIDDLSEADKIWFREAQRINIKDATDYYEEARSRGIANECARFLLPASAATTLYMSGLVRNWIHYIELRTKPDVQLEHRRIAVGIRTIFIAQLPIISEALGWANVQP
jgi:thymidylate synthase (FAD)